MSLLTWRYPGALFTSAGGYHHHVGLNVWAAGSPKASEQDVRMLFWELVLPSEQERQQVVASLQAAGYTQTPSRPDNPAFADPWGIHVALVADPAIV